MYADERGPHDAGSITKLPAGTHTSGVRLVRSSSNTSIAQIAGDLAVSYDALRDWVKQA